MVKRVSKYVAGSLLLMLLVLFAGLGWMLGTTAGARWMLDRVNALPDVRLAAEVSGTIWKGLDLAEMDVSWPGGRVATDRLRYAWNPWALFGRHLSFDRIEVGTVQLELAPAPATKDEQPDTALDGGFWPSLPEWLLASEVTVRSLSLAEFRLVSAGEEPSPVRDVRGGIHFRHGILRGEGLQADFAASTLRGTARLDLAGRLLAADLAWTRPDFFAGWDTVHARFELDEQLAGPLGVDILDGDDLRITLQAAADLEPTGLTLDELVATRSEAPDRVAGEVRIEWGEAFRVQPDLRLTHLDLQPETGWRTDLSGTLLADIDAAGYIGVVDLTSTKPGLEAGWLSATVEGDWRGLVLTDLWARWLEGELVGKLALGWEEGFRLSGDLMGSGINPAALVPDMPGRLDLSVTGELRRDRAGELSASWAAELEESRLRGRPLSGRLAGQWREGDLILEALDLQGDGIHVAGSGRLGQRIDWRLRIDDLERVGRGWAGALDGEGWVARREGEWSGFARGSLVGLAFGIVRTGEGAFRVDYPGPQERSHLEVSLSQLQIQGGLLERVQVTGSGRLASHDLDVRFGWPGGELNGILAGGLSGSDWSGRIQRMTVFEENLGEWRLTKPAPLSLGPEQVTLDELQLIGGTAAQLTVSSDLAFGPLSGTVRADWLRFPLEFLDPWLGGPSLAGTADGYLDLAARADGSLELAAEVGAAPALTWNESKIAFGPSHAGLHWDADGLVAAAEATFIQGGRWDLELSSPAPGRVALPETVRFSSAWSAVDVRQLSPWLPFAVDLRGAWDGEMSGAWRGGRDLQVSGRTAIGPGEIIWRGEDGLLSLPLRTAELTASLASGWLAAELDLALVERGKIAGRARLPVWTETPQDALDASVAFDLDELGLLSVFLPGIANETRGALQGDLRLGGSWQQPQLFGSATLQGAAAEVPSLGLKLRDIGLDVNFTGTRLEIQRFHLTSGEGRLEGSGSMAFSGWRPESWSFDLKGDNVRLLHLPDVTLEATPDLQLTGTTERLTVRGEILVPTLLITEVPKSGTIEPSEDVVVVGAKKEPTVRIFERLDVRVQVKLGDHVAVKARGLDAKLKGSVRVETDRQGQFVGQGVIEVEQGHYAAYGLKLPITRGRALFGGGALEDPTLDVLAERTIGEIKAGVQVTGTPRRPLVRLVSTPAMPDTEILSYIVLGRPLGTEGTENDKLMLAAQALLSQGESAALQEKIKRQIGVDVIEVESGSEEGVTQSMVTIGKYLTPDLYFSFGQSLFTAENVARLRYQFGKNWELESQFGTTSGADISYRIEFR